MKKKIELTIEHAENILKVLDNHVSMGFAMIGPNATKDLTDEQGQKFTDIFYKYHNANCGPFNRMLKELIDKSKSK